MTQHYQQALLQLQQKNQLRQIPPLSHQGKFVTLVNSDKPASKQLLNIASNDYLAIGMDNELQTEFLDYIADMPAKQRPKLGSTSSRLLTGNDVQLDLLESELADWYNANGSSNTQTNKTQTDKSALVFNSGYHANIGLLPALTALPTITGKTLILADKLVHASIIDGMQLATNHNHPSSKVSFKRYRHNDHQHLRKLIEQADASVSRIIIVTESIFSMDGDKADLADLVIIKQTLTTSKRVIELYVDEAHAVGVCGQTGLGVAEESNTLASIDYLVGTFGKAFASMGAYLICDSLVKQWLINSMRPLIFSTALPPMTHAWSRFILAKMPNWTDKRSHLQQISTQLKNAIEQKTGQDNPSESAIIPYILGENELAVNKALELQNAGFFALPIRPPTVPNNTARIRFVMNAGIDRDTCESLIQCL